MQGDLQELEKQEKIKEAIQRKNYYHYQKIRLKRDVTRTNDEKIEAMMIIDELPEDMGIEDADLFRVAEQSIKMHLSLHEKLDEKLTEIRKDFDDAIKDLKGEHIKNLGMLNYRIPILILHFSVLVSNIEDNLAENGKGSFPGFPKFEDWWIKELWINHQAYFGLYKWKAIISSLCVTDDQKRAWDGISANWISVKKFINSKGLLAFEYNYAFDTVMREHSGLEEELATSSLESMKEIVERLTKEEDFTAYQEDHETITAYLKFKREKLNYQDVKGKEKK